MKFIIYNQDQIAQAIKRISQLPIDKKYVVEIYEGKKKRSLSQNDLFHLWIDLIAAELGYSPEDMKIIIKRKILGLKEMTDPFTGEVTYSDYSSAKLTKEQFTRLMTETQIIASEYCNGMILPSPEDYRGKELI